MSLKFQWPVKNVKTTKSINNNRLNSIGYNSLMMGSTTPTWVNVQDKHHLATIYTNNPVAYSTITLKANMMANGIVHIKDLNSGEIYTQESLRKFKGIKNQELINKAFRLFDSPNVLQSRKEFITISSIMKDVFGDQFTYGNSGVDNVNLQTVETLWNIYPQYMSVLLAGNYYSATQLDDIIKKWEWGGYGSGIEFTPEEILHRKDTNIEIKTNEDIIFGKSKLVPLQKPLSNIQVAYESENVVLKNRGARMLISLARKSDDIGGVEPAEPKDIEEVQKEWKEYGLTEDQSQAFITRQPLDVTTIDQDIRKLGIFETIANDSMSVNNAYGIAHDLIKLWISGSTFENQREAERRTYQATIIPEFNDWVGDIDNWLKMAEFGLQYVPSFEHVAVLQEDKKEKATANNITSKYHMDLFLKGAIKYNVWLQSVGLPEDSEIGEKRITELTPVELQAMGISVNVNNGGNDDN